MTALKGEPICIKTHNNLRCYFFHTGLCIFVQRKCTCKWTMRGGLVNAAIKLVFLLTSCAYKSTVKEVDVILRHYVLENNKKLIYKTRESLG